MDNVLFIDFRKKLTDDISETTTRKAKKIYDIIEKDKCQRISEEIKEKIKIIMESG